MSRMRRLTQLRTAKMMALTRPCLPAQEALALASLAKRSLTLPGMQSDWEIDPDELEIARKPDGTEWRLGTGASAHVWTSAPGCSQHGFSGWQT